MTAPTKKIIQRKNLRVQDDFDTNPQPIYSTDVQDFLSKTPNWLIRYGTTVVFFGILSILFLSWFIKYPDVVQGKAKIIAFSAPVTVLSTANGLWVPQVKNSEIVDKDQLIGLVENPANYQDINALKYDIEKFKKKLDEGWKMSFYSFDENYQIGDLQIYLDQLKSSLRSYQNNVASSKNNVNRKYNIEEQISRVFEKNRKLKTQIDILEREKELEVKMYNENYLPLFNEGVIPQAEINIHERRMLAAIANVERAKSTIDDNSNHILQLKNQQSELDFSKADTERSDQAKLKASVDQVLGQIYLWEERYLIKAPLAGKVEFLPELKDQSYVRIEQTLLNIIPEFKKDIYCEMYIGERGSGKVEIGQRVNIDLDSYEKSEFGMIKGIVSEIADVGITVNDGTSNSTNMYLLHIDLPNGTETTYKKSIPFKHNMQGDAEIIVKEKRVIERLAGQLLDLAQE